MSEWFFQECIETDREMLLLAAIESHEIDVEARDCVDRTPLMVALEYGKPEVVKALLVLGANPSGTSDDGGTCLSRAIDAGDFESLRLLIDAGADIELSSSGFYTPLALAATRGNVAMVQYLLQRGANIEARGEMEETPLIEACLFGQAETAALLLRSGADPTAKDACGRSALEAANQWPGFVAALNAASTEASTPPSG